MSVLHRLDKHVQHLPGYQAWLEEQDRAYWLGVLRAAALRHFGTLPDCPGCGSCPTCQLAEALAYTAPSEPRPAA